MRGVGLDDPQRSLLTPTILWFCDSVNSNSTKQTDNSDQVNLKQRGKQWHIKEEKLTELYKPKAVTLLKRRPCIRRSIIKDYCAAHSVRGMEDGKTDLQTSNSKHKGEKWDRSRYLLKKDTSRETDRPHNLCYVQKPVSDLFLPFAF